MRKVQHVADFQQQYDVVTFDPRGIGKSSPIRCDPKAAPKVEMPLDHKPTQAEFDAVARANAAFFKSCADATGELFWHLSAKDTAQDIERMRQALSPNDGLVAYGGSYGSAYGAAYLEAYPQHVKALILDGVVDHTVDFPTFIARNVMSVQDAFERMEQWCAQETKCALHGKDLGAAFDAAIAREPRMRTLVPQMLAGADDPDFGWPMVTQMLAEVSSGGESKMLKEIATALDLSTNDDPCAAPRQGRPVAGRDLLRLRTAARLREAGGHRRHAGQGGAALRLEVLEFQSDRARLGRHRRLRRLAARGGKPAASLEGRAAPRRHGVEPHT